ncbi:MAG: hypothetical protein AAF597_20620, partial [Bacteroidota bacterium]
VLLDSMFISFHIEDLSEGEFGSRSNEMTKLVNRLKLVSAKEIYNCIAPTNDNPIRISFLLSTRTDIPDNGERNVSLLAERLLAESAEIEDYLFINLGITFFHQTH